MPKNASKNEKDSRVHELLEMVGLLENKFSWVKELSGGMKQRVAIARSLVNIPKLLLLDEPFRELDAFTKDILQNDLKKIINSRNVTTILVTHDIDEAIFLSDTLHILSNKPSTLLKTYNLKGLKKSKNSDDFLKIRKEVYNELF